MALECHPVISWPEWEPFRPVDPNCARCNDIALYEVLFGASWGLIGPHVRVAHPDA